MTDSNNNYIVILTDRGKIGWEGGKGKAKGTIYASSVRMGRRWKF